MWVGFFGKKELIRRKMDCEVRTDSRGFLKCWFGRIAMRSKGEFGDICPSPWGNWRAICPEMVAIWRIWWGWSEGKALERARSWWKKFRDFELARESVPMAILIW